MQERTGEINLPQSATEFKVLNWHSVTQTVSLDTREDVVLGVWCCCFVLQGNFREYHGGGRRHQDLLSFCSILWTLLCLVNFISTDFSFAATRCHQIGSCGTTAHREAFKILKATS